MVVTHCPCARRHDVADDIWIQFCKVTAGMPPGVDVTVEGRGTWHVPRIYLACHSVRGIEIPGLARHYGWPEVIRSA